MTLPDKVDPFRKLAAEVTLPPRKADDPDTGPGDGAPRRRSREDRAARRGR